MNMPMMPDDTVSGGVLGGNLDYEDGKKALEASVPEKEAEEVPLKRVKSKGSAFAN
jgi:hypothetical protein